MIEIPFLGLALVGLGWVLLGIIANFVTIMQTLVPLAFAIFAFLSLMYTGAFIVKNFVKGEWLMVLIIVALMAVGFTLPFFNAIKLFGFTFNPFFSKCIILILLAVYAVSIDYNELINDRDTYWGINQFFLIVGTIIVIIALFVNRPYKNILQKVFVEMPERTNEYIKDDDAESLTHYDFLKGALEQLKSEGITPSKRDINEAIGKLEIRKYRNFSCLDFTTLDNGYYLIQMYHGAEYNGFKLEDYSSEYFYVDIQTLDIYDVDMNKLN